MGNILRVGRGDQKRTVDVSTLNREELISLRVEVEQNLREVKQQIKDAQLRFNETGERADPVWYSRATAAQNILGGQLQRIQLALTRLKEKRREKELIRPKGRESFYKCFLHVARRHLSGEDFEKYCKEAEEMEKLVNTPEIEGALDEANKTTCTFCGMEFMFDRNSPHQCIDMERNGNK